MRTRSARAPRRVQRPWFSREPCPTVERTDAVVLSQNRVALVLGGGGLVGQAFHAGALAGLEHDLGWDPRQADLIVGTSAGAVTGTLLRGGVPASDLAAWCTDAQLSAYSRGLIDPADALGEFPPLSWRSFLRPQAPDLATLGRVVRAARRGALSTAFALLPAGGPSVVEHLGFIERLEIRDWPTRDLWICTVRRSDGERVVFGHPAAAPAALNDAVAASCSVPGYFAPVDIDEEQYVDGGARSPTNADLVAEVADADLAIVVSPMSATGPVARSIGGVLRRLCKFALQREVQALEARGLPVLVLEPGPEVVDAMRQDFMSRSALCDVAREGFLQTSARLAEADDAVRRLLPTRLEQAA
jgi:NTE family protein